MSISAGVGSITNAPILGDPPINTSIPNIGKAIILQPGVTITCDEGKWENNPYIFQYQWYRDGVVIFAPEIPEYTLTADDVGRNISCLVIAINEFGKTPQFSNSVYIS